MIVLAVLIAALLLVVAAIVLQSVPIDRVAYFAVGAFVLAVTWNGFRLAGGGISNLILVVAFLAVVLHVVVNRRSMPIPPWLLAAAAGFVVAFLATVVFPPDRGLLDQSLISYKTDFQSVTPLGYIVPRSDFFNLAQYEIALLVIPLMIIAVANTKERVTRLVDLFVLSATVNAAVAFVDYMGLGIAPYATVGGRSSGLTIHPNYLALTCTLGIPLAMLWVSRGGRWRVAGLAALVILMAGTFVSGSRAGAVTAALGIVVSVAALPSLRVALKYVLPVLGVALVPLLVFTPAGEHLLHQVRLSGSNTSGSDSTRADLARVASAQFRAQPIQGVGMGVIEDAHNIYWQLLASGGLIGMVSFITYIGGLASSVRRAFPTALRDTAVAAGISVLMWLVNGRYDAQLADKYLYVVPGILIAAGCVAVTLRERVEEPAPPRAKREQVVSEPLATPSPAAAR